ncbi:lipoprotein [gut metagenome]|uniref:Lipoprotein n=1 Tax=gut metagenome TaxID=749906 RepID=J9GPU0_9ZZZZ
MKKILFLACVCCTFLACENVEKKANEQLQAARSAYEQGDYNTVKNLIDSIKICYPKAFETRKASIRLMQEVELKEQENSLAYLDSMLNEKQADLATIRKKFVLEKDSEYQEVGNYLVPSQVLEKNLHRSYLRFQVDETGLMSMTSIYCGKRPIHHIAVKVTAPDGSFAETPASTDSYETSDLGEKIEKAEYKLGADGSVISFICLHKDKNLRVNYQGEHPYTTSMTAADRQAAYDIYQLAQTLSAITEIKKNQEEALLKKKFILKKMEEKTEKKTDSQH